MKKIWMIAAGSLVLSMPASAQEFSQTNMEPVGGIVTAPPTENAAVPTDASPVAVEPAVLAAPAAMIVGDIPPPPEGKGQVIFFRKGGFVGSAISCAVHENGEKLSRLPPARYHVHIAEPGIHSYSVKSEAEDVLRMEIEPGETYFAKCAITMGIMAGRPNLSPSDLPTFSGMLPKLKLAVNKPEDEKN